MPQNEYIELAQKRHGKRFDHDERKYVVVDRPPACAGTFGRHRAYR